MDRLYKNGSQIRISPPTPSSWMSPVLSCIATRLSVVVLLLVFGTALAGCATLQPEPMRTEVSNAIVRIYFGTNRAFSQPAIASETFGDRRGALTFGIADVSIPRDHRMGVVERPSILRLQFSEDPKKHLVIQSIEVLEGSAWSTRVRSEAVNKRTDRALVFVHGYNVRFDDAVRRTAQLTYDLGYSGIPMLFTWPSAGKEQLYLHDETNAEWSVLDLENFLTAVAKQDQFKEIVVVAHSMGARITSRALARLVGNRQETTKFSQIVLAAPDIDAETFTRELLPRLATAERRVTIYAADKDRAIQASKLVHGSYRLGETAGGLLAASFSDVIDATSVDVSFIGHSYYGDERTLLSDLFSLVNFRQEPAKRFGLKRAEMRGSTYWIFK